jgi:multiple sugar transport system substrate-binding protein
MKKLLTLFFVVMISMCMVAVFSLAGIKKAEAASAEEEVIKLTFWHHEAPAHRVAAFQKVIDLFEEEYPNIKVEQEVVMWGDAWTKTIAVIEAGTGPDFQFSIPDLLLTSALLNNICFLLQYFQ